MKKFLVDSDVLIDFLRGVEKARNCLRKLRREGELLISVINVAEVYSGKEIQDLKKRKIIDEFLSSFEIIPLNENLAKLAGEIRSNYDLPFADAIVGASALATKSVLVTRNIKHFSKIKNLKLKSPK